MHDWLAGLLGQGWTTCRRPCPPPRHSCNGPPGDHLARMLSFPHCAGSLVILCHASRLLCFCNHARWRERLRSGPRCRDNCKAKPVAGQVQEPTLATLTCIENASLFMSIQPKPNHLRRRETSESSRLYTPTSQRRHAHSDCSCRNDPRPSASFRRSIVYPVDPGRLRTPSWARRLRHRSVSSAAIVVAATFANRECPCIPQGMGRQIVQGVVTDEIHAGLR